MSPVDVRTHDQEVVESLESALDSLDVLWKRRERTWVIPVSAPWPHEVTLALGEETVSIQAILASWDDVGSDEREALALLLSQAGQAIPEVRLEVGPKQAVIEEKVTDNLTEQRLVEATLRVVRGARLLSAEATTLLNPEVARHYREFFACQREIPEDSHRT